MGKINMENILLFFTVMLLAMSCADDESLKNEIVGTWPLKSLTTECNPEDLINPNGTIDADESGCVELIFKDSTGSKIITTTQTACSFLRFSVDNTVLMRSGERDSLDRVLFDYTVDEVNNIVKINTGGGFSQEYRFNGSELSSEFALATMTQSDCTRTFVYEK